MILLSLLIGNAYSAPPIKMERKTVQSQSLHKEMEYILWVPTAPPPTEGYPLLVMLHGLGDTATNWSEPLYPKCKARCPKAPLLSLCLMGSVDTGWITWKATSTTHRGYLSLLVLLNKSIPLPKIWAEPHGVVDGMGSTKHWFAEPIRLGQMITEPYRCFFGRRKTPTSPLYTLHRKPVHASFVASKEPREWIAWVGSEQRIALIYGSAEQEKFSKGAQSDQYGRANNINISVLVVDEGVHSWKRRGSSLFQMRWLTDVQNP